jgi:hypothetical protein
MLRRMQLEKEEIARLQLSRQPLGARLPEVDLVDARPIGKKSEPVGVRETDEEAQPVSPGGRADSVRD